MPAYNEEVRLPETLSQILTYLGTQAYEAELIVVDDGSDDRTADVVEVRLPAHPNLHLIRNPHRGKGYAVRSGVLAAAGSLVFLCDADLSMPIDELGKFIPLMDAGWDIAIGSREAQGARRYNEPFYRHLMGRVFNGVVRLIAVGQFQDTQCGFKCFRTEVARDLFERVMLYRDGAADVTGPMVTGFDVEVLFLALKLGYRVIEVPVNWYYAAGSKVNPVKDTYRMFRDVVGVRLNYWRGRYDLPPAAGRADAPQRR